MTPTQPNGRNADRYFGFAGRSTLLYCIRLDSDPDLHPLLYDK